MWVSGIRPGDAQWLARLRARVGDASGRLVLARAVTRDIVPLDAVRLADAVRQATGARDVLVEEVYDPECREDGVDVVLV
jgi:hypothetical protein